MVNLHWATLLLTESVPDYVIVHDLAYWVEANHTPEFWLRFRRAPAEYEQRERWLPEHGASVVVL